MQKKYYLDELGLIKVLLDVSGAINLKTSSRLTFTEVENPNTGETTLELQNPNNFATVGAVYDYVANSLRKNLTINKQSAVESEEGYDVQNNIIEYNGSETVQINLDLIDYSDIKKLFI